MVNHSLGDLLDSDAALEHLRQLWNMPDYDDNAWRQYRFRLRQDPQFADIQPALSSHAATWWDKNTLNRIPKPGTKPRKKRKRKGGDANGTTTLRMSHRPLRSARHTQLTRSLAGTR